MDNAAPSAKKPGLLKRVLLKMRRARGKHATATTAHVAPYGNVAQTAASDAQPARPRAVHHTETTTATLASELRRESMDDTMFTAGGHVDASDYTARSGNDVGEVLQDMFGRQILDAGVSGLDDETLEAELHAELDAEARPLDGRGMRAAPTAPTDASIDALLEEELALARDLDPDPDPDSMQDESLDVDDLLRTVPESYRADSSDAVGPAGM